MMTFARRALLIGLAVLAASGLFRLRFDANVLDLLPPDLPQVQGLKIFLKHFGLPSELIITIEGPDTDTTGQFTKSLTEHLRAKTPSLIRSSPPWTENPESLVELAAHALINQPAERFRDTLAKFEPDQASALAASSLESLATTLAPEEIVMLGYDPLGLLAGLSQTTDPGIANREFSSSDGKFRVLYATPLNSPKNQHPPPGWIDAVIGEIQKWREADPSRKMATIGWTGEPAFVHEISSAMSTDMRWSSLTSLAFAAGLFFIVHRRLHPLARMMGYVVASFLGALGISAWIFPDLSIISVGFAAILAGVTVDYGFLLYQHRLRVGSDLDQLRSATAPGIIAAASTTSVAFLSLNFSGLPGIAQLGTTVAIGVALGAFLMIRFFAADLARMPLKDRNEPPKIPPCRFFRLGTAVAFALLTASLAGLVLRGFPDWSVDTQSMRPRESIAYPSLDRMSLVLGNDKPVIQVLATGDSSREVADKLAAARGIFQNSRESGAVVDFELPDSLWPNPEWRSANLAAAQNAVARQQEIHAVLEGAGFAESGTALTNGVLGFWGQWAESGDHDFPRGESFEWIGRRTMSHDGDEFAACGFFSAGPEESEKIAGDLLRSGLFPASWGQLGAALADHALTRGVVTMAVFFGVMAIVLAMAFRNAAETLLALGANLAGMLMLNGLMSLCGLEWNFMNLCALTLTVGLGVDYSIHVIYALRSKEGDWPAAFSEVGIALGLCALTTIVGFGSLGAARTEGLASLGVTCALGVAINALIALFLLPLLWRMARREKFHVTAR